MYSIMFKKHKYIRLLWTAMEIILIFVLKNN